MNKKEALKKLIQDEFEKCNNISEFKEKVLLLIEASVIDITVEPNGQVRIR